MDNKKASSILIFIITLLFSMSSFAAIPVEVSVGKEAVITLKKLSKRISIADCNIADIKSICGYSTKGDYRCVKVMKEKCDMEKSEKEKGEEAKGVRDIISINEVVINGKKPGVTTLIVWDTEGKTFFDVIVLEKKGTDIERAFENRLEALKSDIKAIAPNDDISVGLANDTIVLSGNAVNQQTIDKVVQLANAYAIASQVSTTKKYSAGLTEESTTTTGKVLNHIKIKEAQQVLLEVRVAQIDRSKLKELGVSVLIKGSDAEGFSNLAGAPTGILGEGTTFSKAHGYSGTSEGAYTDSVSRTNTFDNLTGRTTGDTTTTTQEIANTLTSTVINDKIRTRDTSIQGFDLETLTPQIGISYFPSGVSVVLKALATKGLAKILAEPNLVVRSRQSGIFFAGTQVPIQIVYGTPPTPAIEYRDVGIKLNFAPEVLETGVIRLKIDPAYVSSITRYITFAGGLVAPEIDTREVRTSVDLKEGESLILAGLLSEEMIKNMQKIPILGDIPILGALFRSTSDELDQKELAFFITPKLVKPIPAGEETELKKSKLPGVSSPTPEEEKEFQWIPWGK